MTATPQEFPASHQMISNDVELGQDVRLSSFINLYGWAIAVVSSEIPNSMLAVGIPARVVRSDDDQNEKTTHD